MKNIKQNRFIERHIGPRENDIKEMLEKIGADSINDLIYKSIPDKIRIKKELEIDEPVNENQFLKDLKKIADKNKIYKSYIGLGYYSTITPSVIIRNILENPGWYTQYTPYQAEISQGRLEALLNFQTMVIDLTGLPLANSSLLDEATAAAEAMTMFFNLRKGEKKNSNTFFVSIECFPQTIDVLKTRANPLGIKLQIGNHRNLELNNDIFGILVQYPSGDGEIYDYSGLFKDAEENEIYKIVAADLLSLALLTPPGEFGADAVVGTTQRFGVPMGFGGPQAGYFATRKEYKRNIPGRIIGSSIDVKGRPALRMALQTREQHIKRERATSNICTAQVLLAIMAGMYAVYHGPEGVKAISEKIHGLTRLLDIGLKKLGIKQVNHNFYDTLKVKLNSSDELKSLLEIANSNEINFRYLDDVTVGISFGETDEIGDVEKILKIFSKLLNKSYELNINELLEKIDISYPDYCNRKSNYLTHQVFNSYHSETEMMRYLKRLENKDLSLTTSMIPLGSCTMKLNSSTEMFGISWPEFSNLHPFVPRNQSLGYQELIDDLGKQLCEITGFSAISFQPNSGAQGEYTGLMVIREYHRSKGEDKRNVVLIPSSAHGTNPASAVMASGRVVIISCDNEGNIELDDLKSKVEEHKDNLSAIMVTYPSTHGVFEENIVDLCKIIHDNGGQVYMDGANMNAQVGYTSPFKIGADVCHLNLHKTFSIPHGGGGPGMGPICVAKHLVPFLPNHPIVPIGTEQSISAVSAAPWGSAGILPISYAYIKMLGREGLMKATEIAILNANYIMELLKPYYKILYTGKLGYVAHELIFDLREFKTTTNVDTEDIAKRLMDYGFHAPTVSFPVAGTFMVEPTESESKEELERFCEAMISIRNEIEEIEKGVFDKEDNVLKNAPHTSEDVTSDSWNHPYTREKAAFPSLWTKQSKFWPSVGRVNNAYGDRNLVCSCLPIEVYQEESTN